MKAIIRIIVIIFVLSAQIATAVQMKYRIPTADDVSTIDVHFRFGEPYGSYTEAMGVLNRWNETYNDKEIEYTKMVEEWRATCDLIIESAEERAVFEEYSYDEYKIVPVYYEDLGIWVFGWQKITTNDVIKMIPDYELPDKPRFYENDCEKVKSAYSYLKNDGLSKDEWYELKLVLYFVNRIESGKNFDFGRNEEILSNLIEEGYVKVNEDKGKSLLDTIRGSKDSKKYEVAFTDDGFSRFTGLIDRCWDFRKGLSESALESGVINTDEYTRIVNDNDKIRKEFKKQLENKKDWSPHGPSELSGTFLTFAINKESVLDKYPYKRVSDNIPDYKEPPKYSIYR